MELIDGEIIKIAPIGSLRAGRVDQLTRLFILTFGQNAVIRVQNPIVLDALRPIFHQHIERIEAHIFIAFLA